VAFGLSSGCLTSRQGELTCPVLFTRGVVCAVWRRRPTSWGMSDRKAKSAAPPLKQRRRTAIEQSTALLPPLAALIVDYLLVERDWARAAAVRKLCPAPGWPCGMAFGATSTSVMVRIQEQRCDGCGDGVAHFSAG
jgi:hypothetical protein